MMISSGVAMSSLCRLRESGSVSDKEYLKLKEGVEARLSFRRWVMNELGEFVGTFYLREEVAEINVLNSIKIEPDKISVPEWISLSLDKSICGWHTPEIVASPWAEEKGEKWHLSLLLMPSINNKISVDNEKTSDIVRKVYGLNQGLGC